MTRNVHLGFLVFVALLFAVLVVIGVRYSDLPPCGHRASAPRDTIILLYDRSDSTLRVARVR